MCVAPCKDERVRCGADEWVTYGPRGIPDEDRRFWRGGAVFCGGRGFLSEIGRFAQVQAKLSRQAGTFRLGTPDAPFRAHVLGDLSSMLLEGELELQTEKCEPGPVQVHTVERLAFAHEALQMTGGILELESSEGTAIITFNENGSVTLEDTEGRTRTIQPEAVPNAWDSDCFSS